MTIHPLMEQAEAYLARQDVDRAAELYRRALELDESHSPLPLVGLARIGLALGQLDDAQDLLERALARDACCVEALTFRGVTAEVQGLSDQGLGWLERAVARDGSYAPAWFNLGRLLAQTKQWDKARDAFARAGDLTPSDVQTRVNEAVCAVRAGDAAAGIQILLASVSEAPNHIDALVTLADALVESTQLDLADEILDHGERRFPKVPVFPAKRSALALRRGDPQIACAFARRQMALEPNSAEGWLFLASLEMMLLDLNAAEACAQRALSIDPQNWRAHHCLGSIYKALRLETAALVAFRRAIDLGGTGDPQNDLAVLLLERGSTEEVREARTLLEQETRRTPLAPKPRYNLALALAKQGQQAACAQEISHLTRCCAQNDPLALKARQLLLHVQAE